METLYFNYMSMILLTVTHYNYTVHRIINKSCLTYCHCTSPCPRHIPSLLSVQPEPSDTAYVEHYRQADQTTEHGGHSHTHGFTCRPPQLVTTTTLTTTRVQWIARANPYVRMGAWLRERTAQCAQYRAGGITSKGTET